MSDVSLDSLRRLRKNAQDLLKHVQGDLRPFVKEDGTFRRKPDSPSEKGDVNVTTTCSCLMALAVTDTFEEFYKHDKIGITADDLVSRLIEAPWMSSGLTANNAFTTALVLRAFGFLKDYVFDVVARGADSRDPDRTKDWQLHFGIDDAAGLYAELRKQEDATAEFLWLSLSDKVQDRFKKLLGDASVGRETKHKLKSEMAVDLQRLVQSGWIFAKARFDKASQKTAETLATKPTGYKLAELNESLIADQYPQFIKSAVPRSLKEIAESISENVSNFSINDYPPSAAVVYWFVDGISRAEIELGEKCWKELCDWAAREFNHKRSLVVAGHDAMMDPVEMGMAACLCARLRSLNYTSKVDKSKEYLKSLPSRVELEKSIEELFSQQTETGIWNKYFPIFHYQDAGSNFCFTFELLEAVLCEFGCDEYKLLDNPKFIEGLERSINWCKRNRSQCSYKKVEYTGWSSGGYLETLEKGYPESWATAVVHMFLWELTTVVSRRIQEKILEQYKARAPRVPVDASKDDIRSALDRLLDIEVVLRGKPESLVTVLRERIVDKYSGQNELTLRRKSMNEPRSALLFGPPGTSKTELAKAMADELGWPLVELAPSDFVRDTLPNIYSQTERIFTDLMDLSGVVVLFDEMDALVRTREGNSSLDITREFLTTTMLPKLARLHDDAPIVFFMATNFQESFDIAIKRAGRFDLLLCVGPPTLGEKLDRLHVVYRLKKSTDQTTKAGQLIKTYLQDQPRLRDQLELYTFAEFRALLRTIAEDAKTIGTGLETLGEGEFRKKLEDNNKYVTLKLDELGSLEEETGIKWPEIMQPEVVLRNAKGGKITRSTEIIRYLCDRGESKEQH